MQIQGKWITVEEETEKCALYWFSHSLNLAELEDVMVRISADTRYVLYINGKSVCEGPAQGSAYERSYETENISAYLKPGKNEIQVKILHVCGKFFTTVFPMEKPMLWFELQQGGKNLLVSDLSWEIRKIQGVDFVDGPEINVSLPHFEVHAVPYKEIPQTPAEYRETFIENDSANAWGECKLALRLTKRSIPQMKTYAPREMKRVQEVLGGYVLDAEKYTTAKVKIKVRGQKGDILKLTYGECYLKKADLWNGEKGLRDDKSGIIYGVFDTVALSGETQGIEFFWYRAFRYIQVTCENPEKLDLKLTYSPYFYPLDITGAFTCSDGNYNKMWEVSENTLLCCMHDIFVDCPYFEQQQYGMDSYLECMFNLCISNDTRMVKKVISNLADSQQANGLLCANYPARFVQIIPTFSIYWLMLLHDYYMYSGDKEFVKKFMGVTDKMLWGFEQLLNQDGVVKSCGWPFVDWAFTWENGVPNGGRKEPIAVYSMQYSLGLKYAAFLAKELGRTGLAEEYEERRHRLNKAIKAVFWNKDKQYYNDTVHTKEFSQHTGMWAILSELEMGERAEKIAEVMLHPDTVTCSFSMGFFLFRALEKLNMYEKAFPCFEGFQTMLDWHCTTWCENPGNPRSECHAWSAAPLYEFPTQILGVKSKSIGFHTAEISPCPGHLTFAKGKVATPFGDIAVEWEKQGDKILLSYSAPREIEITLGKNVVLK